MNDKASTFENLAVLERIIRSGFLALPRTQLEIFLVMSSLEETRGPINISVDKLSNYLGLGGNHDGNLWLLDCNCRGLVGLGLLRREKLKGSKSPSLYSLSKKGEEVKEEIYALATEFKKRMRDMSDS